MASLKKYQLGLTEKRKGETMPRGLDLLEFNHAGALRLKDGRIVNYGVIERFEDHIVSYTGKGLREIWASDMTAEQKQVAEILKAKTRRELMETGHVFITPLGDIDQVLH